MIKLKVKVKKTKKIKSADKANLKAEQNDLKAISDNRENGVSLRFQSEKKIERDKNLMMWTGVSFFMVLFFVLWLINIENVFKKVEEDKNNSRQFEWNKIKDEFSQTVGQVKANFVALKQAGVLDNIISTTTEANIDNSLPAGENSQLPTSTPPAISGKTFQPENEDSIVKLRDRLRELEKNINN